jgi:hypothetical protein
MPLNQNDSAMMNMISSLLIVIGLPIGFYVVFVILNPIDHLKYASSGIGEGFIRGVQRGINETELIVLVQKLTQTVIVGATIVPEVQLLRNRFHD